MKFQIKNLSNPYQKEITALLKQCHIWVRQTRLNPQGRIVLNQIIKRLNEISSLAKPHF